jgi:hypothetical protein
MEPSSGLAVLCADSGSSTAGPASLNERWLELWVTPTLAALEERIWAKAENIEYCIKRKSSLFSALKLDKLLPLALLLPFIRPTQRLPSSLRLRRRSDLAVQLQLFRGISDQKE